MDCSDLAVNLSYHHHTAGGGITNADKVDSRGRHSKRSPILTLCIPINHSAHCVIHSHWLSTDTFLYQLPFSLVNLGRWVFHLS